VARQIPLSQGFVAIVDDEDYETVAAHKWSAKAGRRTFYAYRCPTVGGRRETLYLHSFLTGWSQVDHRDGNGLDCRRDNMRPATYAENGQNRPRRSDNTSGYKGVSWRASGSTWQARITVEGRTCSLGSSFPTPESAAHAYDLAAMELHGEFARLNFPTNQEA
jgi:hypothetical protein